MGSGSAGCVEVRQFVRRQNWVEPDPTAEMVAQALRSETAMSRAPFAQVGNEGMMSSKIFRGRRGELVATTPGTLASIIPRDKKRPGTNLGRRNGTGAGSSGIRNPGGARQPDDARCRRPRQQPVTEQTVEAPDPSGIVEEPPLSVLSCRMRSTTTQPACRPMATAMLPVRCVRDSTPVQPQATRRRNRAPTG